MSASAKRLKALASDMRESAKVYRSDARNVDRIILALETKNSKNLRKYVRNLDTYVREQVIDLLTKKEQQITGWLSL